MGDFDYNSIIEYDSGGSDDDSSERNENLSSSPGEGNFQKPSTKPTNFFANLDAYLHNVNDFSFVEEMTTEEAALEQNVEVASPTSDGVSNQSKIRAPTEIHEIGSSVSEPCFDDDTNEEDNETAAIESVEMEPEAADPDESDPDDMKKMSSIRKSFSIKFKTQMVEKYKSSGQSKRGFAAANNLKENNLRRWITQCDKMAESVLKGTTKIKVNRRLPGGGRKALFPDLEQKLFVWIKERNEVGLRVKDKYIVGQMKALRDEAIQDISNAGQAVNDLERFKVSQMWLHRFKQRRNLVSRRETSCRSLPDDYQNLAKSFLKEVNDVIRDKKILSKRIVNLDQVPRYCELNNGSTITEKGSKNVMLKKSSTSHKRFTVTPVISADGCIKAIHVLFSNLKNRPSVHKDCSVDVNKTGMWSTTILENFLNEILIPRLQSPFHEPTLIILDAYGAHLKFLNPTTIEQYEKRNVFFKVIPAKLTGLLQPLDVVINRGLQKSFDDQYVEYLEKALKSPECRTKQGNIKMPSYLQLSEWCFNWSVNVPKEQIVKAFEVCGIGKFDVTNLHEALRLCFQDVLTAEETETLENVISSYDDSNVYQEDDDEDECTWIAIDSIFQGFFKKIRTELSYEEWLNEFQASMKELCRLNPLTNSVIDELDEKRVYEEKELSESHFELMLGAQMMNMQIVFVFEGEQKVFEPVQNLDRIFMKVENGALFVKSE